LSAIGEEGDEDQDELELEDRGEGGVAAAFRVPTPQVSAVLFRGGCRPTKAR